MERRNFVRGAAAAMGSLAAVPALAQTANTADPAGTTPPPRDWNQSSTVVYPDPAMEVFDPKFKKYIAGTAEIRRLWTGGAWTEGPVYFGDIHSVIFSDIPNNRLMRFDELTGQTTVFPGARQFRQWQHARPAGPADHVRAGRPPRHPDRVHRRDHPCSPTITRARS